MGVSSRCAKHQGKEFSFLLSIPEPVPDLDLGVRVCGTSTKAVDPEKSKGGR
jgi:hypothetical protein